MAPGESETVSFTFFGHVGVKSEVIALCDVEGGPVYELQLSGEASSMHYNIDSTEIDLGLVVSSLSLFNCSQTKFVAIILVLRYFYAFFHLTNFLSDAYDFTFCCPRALSFAARGHS